ncbi:protein mono-ADP-ribosyltransferase PARP12-like [Oreochromis aureus]|uniref:protein mono-ADP-ribosyltransferase PARP12-like n=1 Tax=Oreochromis aureus TaxID=47969 RepID=UPI001954AEC2|nr:protein mono-ADP-ribosyltransferase PARP12-like [Oreochromis aureus]
MQTNKHYGTKRLVRRRPRFVSAADALKKKVRSSVQTSASIPKTWDNTQIPQTGYSRIPLQPSSEEFKEVAALFYKTMKDCDNVNIERIQNKALWEAFQLTFWLAGQSVRIGNRTSASIITNTGVPQGCVLSPILYTLYTQNCHLQQG